jgi:monoamine oxidase
VSVEHVVIVGAGAAGLSAADVLRGAGRRVTLIEAGTRIGGRVFTDVSLGAPFDAGAMFVHFAERNPWTALAMRHGTPAHGLSPPPWENAVTVRDGARLDRDLRRRRRGAFWRLLERLGEEGPAFDVSMAEAARRFGDEDAVGATRDVMRGLMGEDAERVSARDILDPDEGENLVVPGGYGTLLTRAYADVPVAFGTEATGIDWSGPGVAVETNRGTVTADAAILTVSVGVLPRLRFTPALPEAHRSALDGLVMGALTKIALRFEGERFGFEPWSSLLSWQTGGATVDTWMWIEGGPIAIAHLGGDEARDLVAEGEAAAINFALGRLEQAIGPKVRRAFRGGRLADWWSDPLHRGSYSVMLPGHAGARDALAAAIGDKLYLAGEATAGVHAMTVGGATLAGAAAARALLGQR